MKAFAFLISAVAALLVLVAPTASAHEQSSCPSTTDAHGNSGQLNVCNVYGQGNGVGNTLNGMPIPALPAAPVILTPPAAPAS